MPSTLRSSPLNLPQNSPPPSDPLQISTFLRPISFPQPSPPPSEPLCSLGPFQTSSDHAPVSQTLTSLLRPFLLPQTIDFSPDLSPYFRSSSPQLLTLIHPQTGNHQHHLPQPFQTPSGPSTDVLLPSPVWAEPWLHLSQGAGEWEVLACPSNPTASVLHLDEPRPSEAQFPFLYSGVVLYIPPLSCV